MPQTNRDPTNVARQTNKRTLHKTLGILQQYVVDHCPVLISLKQGGLHAENSYKFEIVSIIIENSEKENYYSESPTTAIVKYNSVTYKLHGLKDLKIKLITNRTYAILREIKQRLPLHNGARLYPLMSQLIHLLLKVTSQWVAQSFTQHSFKMGEGHSTSV
jgi:hypothetical protein